MKTSHKIAIGAGGAAVAGLLLWKFCPFKDKSMDPAFTTRPGQTTIPGGNATYSTAARRSAATATTSRSSVATPLGLRPTQNSTIIE